MEGKGEIEIPRRPMKRNKERLNKKVWQHPQLGSNSSISQGDNAMSNENYNSASNNDHLSLNSSERTSYNSIALKDSESSTLLSSRRFDEDDGNDHAAMYNSQHEDHMCSNDEIEGNFVEERTTKSPGTSSCFGYMVSWLIRSRRSFTAESIILSMGCLIVVRL